ncbi:hypothetical protein BDV93DRAFT_445071 [Ceratobasidium sp. AG-I]|nr:hypothetical protein BDV93DRAFT_445071 [Ceratobasidium sp. AG-I]
MSNASASDHSSNDISASKHIKITPLSPRNTIAQDVSVSLDILKAEARDRLEQERESHPNEEIESSEDEDNCIICLQPVVDRAVLINCAHDRMCFVCIKQWTEQSRRCPLCNTSIGSHLIHRIRSQYDYQKHYLPPIRTSPPPSNIVAEARAARRVRARRGECTHHPRNRQLYLTRERDELDRAIERRRWVYRYGLFAKHVASNAHTRFRPNPTPQQLSNSAELQSRCQMFVRRELRVWPNLDVEFLTSFIISLVKSIDIRTEAAIKLIAEFLDIGGRTSPAGGTIAEHFVHELYSYLRSPFRELPAYDVVVQVGISLPVSVSVAASQYTNVDNIAFLKYDTPPDAEDAPPLPRANRSSNTNHRSDRAGEHISSRDYSIRREREPSNPLDASPRDAEDASDSGMDVAEDWVEPPPSSESYRRQDKERMPGQQPIAVFGIMLTHPIR